MNARMRRLQLPMCSYRQDAAAHMAGAIFMSNSETRDDCFGTGVFGLPPEYQHFVANVKQGMPLFLFDYTDRNLYGVFEATSDGGMDIRRGAFRSAGRTYPAQVNSVCYAAWLLLCRNNMVLCVRARHVGFILILVEIANCNFPLWFYIKIPNDKFSKRNKEDSKEYIY